MYTPKYLEWLGCVEKDAYGWPVFVTMEAREWAVTAIRRGFSRWGCMDLDQARRCIFEDDVREKGEGRHDCLRLGLWDAQYGVTYRALLAANATEIWELKE